ncbi:multiple cyclophane-containing RiPP AmcA [Streptomyces buecherae]
MDLLCIRSASSPSVRMSWDNRPTWDNASQQPSPWDNRPTWDNWNKKK